MYAVKEIYYTLQGEGANAGRPAVFLRFAGCNLWSGQEKDREVAICKFCDTQFVGTDGPNGGRFADPMVLASVVRGRWPVRRGAPERGLVVCTGGEPLLQLDDALIAALHREGLEVAVETNGTLRAPAGLDWICVSPKANAPLLLTSGDELKLVYPQVEPEVQPELLAGLKFQRFFLQPMDGPNLDANTRSTITYCLTHPQWRLSLQTHKLIGLP